MRKRNRKFKVTVIGAMLVVVGFVPALPVAAEDGAKIPLKSYKEVQSSVTLTMDTGGENGSLNAGGSNPDEAGKVIRRTATVKLTDTNGYMVKIKGNEDLKGANGSNTIPSVSSATTLGQMSNQWGWSGAVGDAVADCNSATMTFAGMSSTEEKELGNGGAISGEATKRVTMCFGARVNGEKAADTYSNTITLSVVAQPGKVGTFGGITKMQEMTADICKAASINDTAQLEDTRDGKKYWVTKLLDGNCWMSQNLALDITTSGLSSSDTDITANWTSSSTYPPQTTADSVTIGSGASSTETCSWNLGEYVAINPASGTSCGKWSTSLAGCTGQFTSVSEKIASSDPNFYVSNGASIKNDEYDAHYLVGNYYQWNAATAGTGGTLGDDGNATNASGSICPKGWKMPNIKGATENGSFYYMLSQYGVESTVSGTSNVSGSDGNNNTYNIALSPLFFVRGGTVDPGDYIGYAGLWGEYWTSLSNRDTYNAYGGRFDADSVFSTSTTYRSHGISVRCLVPTT